MASRQTKLRMRRGIHKIPIQYRILTVDLLKKKDKKEIAKTVIKLISPKDAKALTGFKSKWGFTAFGYPLEGGVLKYKGAEVAIFYKRTTETVVPEPEDPLPEGWLEREEDVWVRLDLTGKSARQLSGQLREDLSLMERELHLRDSEIESLTSLLEAKEKQVKGLQSELDKNKRRK